MDGYQLAAEIRKHYPSTKIQLASGFADNYNAGMVDDELKRQIIRKPYTSQTLLKTVRTLLDG